MKHKTVNLPPLFRLETILQACEDGQVILTPTQRLRDRAIQAWNRHRQSQGERVWRAPKIFSLVQWLDLCWQKLQTQAFEPSFQCVINAQQERVLWEQIIADFGSVRPDALARQAAGAYRVMQLWQLNLDQLQANQLQADQLQDSTTAKVQSTWSQISLSTEIFKRWGLDYQKQLRSKRLLTSEDRLAIVMQASFEGILHREPILHLLGFNDLPPLHQATLKQLSSELVGVDLCTSQPQKLQRLVLADRQAEMQAAARWSRAILETTPQARIGIIVPDLGRCRAQIERAFREVFDGRCLRADQPVSVLPVNISAGVPLVETALITDTLALLRFYRESWPVAELTQLLHSPFWGKLSQQRSLRCQLANCLEALGVFKVRLSEVRYQLQKLSEVQTQQDDLSVLKIFSAAAEYTRHHAKSAVPSIWVERFLKLLEIIQWPGERPSNSLEYQQTRQWHELLEAFASLDQIMGHVSCVTAIQQITRMAGRQPFQPELPDTPIQVLGVLEASGLYFNHCWLLGFDQQSWPPAPQPNPLLPIALQRQQQMPHASHERELAFAQSLTRQFRHCGRHIIFSSPAYDPDTEQPLSSSNLIRDIELLDDFEAASNDFEVFSQCLFEIRQFESIACHQGPPVTATELNSLGELPGGAGVVKAYANNPFDAFASYRLNARRPPPAVLGFSAFEQGNILHQSLAAIWQQLGSQQQLLDLTESQCQALVQQSVSEAIQSIQRRKRDHLGSRLCELEEQRQLSLILAWLRYEKQRPAFSVAAIEQDLYFHHRHIKLKLRIDRMDRLADGSFLIIDYKTGSSRLSQWQGERPAEPQLPLYLLSHPGPVAGIAFAQINVDRQTLIGLEDGKHPTDGLKSIEQSRIGWSDNWDDAKNLWKKTIKDLLNSHLNGQCPVDYRDSIGLQRGKDLLALNRYFDKYRN